MHVMQFPDMLLQVRLFSLIITPQAVWAGSQARVNFPERSGIKGDREVYKPQFSLANSREELS